MATAVTATASGSKSQDAGDRLLPASLVAALFLLVGLGLVGYGIPKVLASLLPGHSFALTFVRVLIQLAALIGVVWLGARLAAANPIRGLRGGTFIVLATVVLAFLLWCWIGRWNLGIGPAIVGAVVGIALAAAAVKFLISDRSRSWTLALENQGWFHSFSYKRTQGLKMRRYTIVGILAIGLSGVWTLLTHKMIGEGELKIRLPLVDDPVAILADKQYAVPLLLAAAILWLAWRAVNMPVFADFLIATEAEMNKVSWTPRKRLIQDTVVVLVTTLILTAFLLVIDLFWGWLLSLSIIGVLPSKDKLNELKHHEPVTQQAAW